MNGPPQYRYPGINSGRQLGVALGTAGGLIASGLGLRKSGWMAEDPMDTSGQYYYITQIDKYGQAHKIKKHVSTHPFYSVSHKTGEMDRGRKRTRTTSMPVTPARSRSGVRAMSVSRSRSRGRSMPRTPIMSQRSRSLSRRRANRRSVSRVRFMRPAATSSRSGGFFSGGTKRRSMIDLMAKDGVVIAKEEGGVLVADIGFIPGGGVSYGSAVYIGHSTVPVVAVAKHFWRAFLKYIWSRLNRDIRDFNDICNPNNQMRLNIKYKLSPNGAVQDYDFTIAVTLTFEDIVNDLHTNLWNINGGNNYFIECTVREASSGSIASTTIIGQFNLQKAKLTFHCKSALKVQNQTLENTADNEADDIKNVPLYGKSYEGAGNGAFYVKQFNQQHFVGNDNTGVIQFLPGPKGTPTGDITQSLNEPPSITNMKYVKKVGKAHIDPGQVKTSVLSYTKTMSFSTFWNRIHTDSPDNPHWTRLGNFRFFGLEKMIQFSPTVVNENISIDNRIKVAYEHDCKFGMKFSCPKVTNTTYIVEQAPQ
jgi:hypothetical protein